MRPTGKILTAAVLNTALATGAMAQGYGDFETESRNDETAFFRIVDLSPNAPAFDICGDGAPLVVDLFYRDQTDYLPLQANTDVTLTRHFAGNGCSTAPDLLLNTTPVPGGALPAGRFVSGLPIASFFEGKPEAALVGPPALVVVDRSEVSDGVSAVRFVNVAINGADSVDFIVDGTVVAGNVNAIRENTILIAPGMEEAIPYVDLSPGPHDFMVVDNATGEVVASQTFDAENARAQTLYFHGSAGGDPGLELLYLRDGRAGQ